MHSDASHQAAVLGAGSWGTALAIHLGGVGHPVTLWGRDRALIDEMVSRRANPTYLPDLTFPKPLTPVPVLAEALAGARHVIVAVPSHGLRAVVRAARPHIPEGAILVSATKGIETDTLQRMSEVLIEETAGRHAVVVLVLAAPQSDVDKLTIAEAKAGAAAAGAGFATVNVAQNAQVAALSALVGSSANPQDRLLDAPAVLVFQRPTTLYVRLNGYSDADTIRQAAVNAEPAPGF